MSEPSCTCTLIARGLPPVTQRLGHVDPANLLRTRKVRDRSSDPKHPVEASRGQPHGCSSVRQKLPPGLIRGRCAVEHLPLGLRIRPHTGAVVTVRLHLPCKGYSAGHLGAAFGRRRKRKVRSRHALNVNMQVYAAQQWPRDPGL
jgi:hypothetical protein